MKNTMISLCLIFLSLSVHPSEITPESLAKVIVRFENELERTGFDPEDCDNIGSYAEDRACLEEKRSTLTESFSRFSTAVAELTSNDRTSRQLIETHTLWEEWFETDRDLYMYFSAGNGSGAGGFTDEEFIKRLKIRIDQTEKDYIQYFIRKKGVNGTALKKKLAEFRKLLETAADLCPQHDYDYKTDSEIIRTPQKCDKAISIYENILGRDCEEIIEDSIIKAELLISTGSDEEALALIEKTRKMLPFGSGGAEYEEALLTELSGDAYSHLGHPATAVSLYDRAVYMYEKIIDNRDYRNKFDAYHNISDIREKRVKTASMSDRESLQKRFSESMDNCLKQTSGTGEYCAAELYVLLARGYVRMGDIPEARSEYETAIEKLLNDALSTSYFGGGEDSCRQYLERFRYYMDEYLETIKETEYCSTAAGYILLWNSDMVVVLRVILHEISPHNLFEEYCKSDVNIEEINVEDIMFMDECFYKKTDKTKEE